MGERVFFVNEPGGPVTSHYKKQLESRGIDLVSCPNPNEADEQTPVFLVRIGYRPGDEDFEMLRRATSLGFTVAVVLGNESAKWKALISGADDIIDSEFDLGPTVESLNRVLGWKKEGKQKPLA